MSSTETVKAFNYFKQYAGLKKLIFSEHYYLDGAVSVLDSRAYTVARFVSEFGFQSMPFLRVWKKNTVDSDLVGGLESAFVKSRQHSMGGNDKVFDQTAQLFISLGRELEFKISKFSEFIFLSQVEQYYDFYQAGVNFFI